MVGLTKRSVEAATRRGHDEVHRLNQCLPWKEIRNQTHKDWESGENVERRLEVFTRNHIALRERRQLEKKATGPTMILVDIQGIIDGLWRGEIECIGPKAKDAHLWVSVQEELHRVHQEGILVEVEHIKAHRSEKEKQRISLFEKFITESNEKSDDQATYGAMVDGEVMAQLRGTTVQQQRAGVYAALQYAASLHCLWEDWQD